MQIPTLRFLKEIIIIIIWVISEYSAFMLFVLVLEMKQNLWHDLWVSKKMYLGYLGKYKLPSNMLI